MSNSQETLRELDRVEDRIRQHLQVVKEPILLVEGPDDQQILELHLPNVSIFAADGKVNALRATDSLESWKMQFMTVIDRDFDSTEELSAHVYPYDRRDLESMLIGLGVLALVLQHQGSSEKLSNLGGPDALVERLEGLAVPAASLRHRNAQEEYGLIFDEVDLGSKVVLASLEFQTRSYCAALLSKSRVSIAIDRMLEIAAEDLPDLHGPRGKDVVALAGASLRRIAGSLPSAAATESVLTGQLHSSAGLALSKSDWLTKLCDRLIPIP
ncbi:hypothetical protein ASF79_09585 [Agreia sp. Leaf335]|uniref:DUF4435 domain-containing protein n=1 Tax=Agreia sp. Leaf335 TaxID=1736340 RepID=UPI0006FA25DF|nr:DUF4435 domain-containing protein [Agreia sp. Leaf335]KQR22475.1 hypothetical protein ASF79_09585 [Agreia sp. Leaf335]